MNSINLFSVLFVVWVSLASASIPSFGLQTAQSIRSSLTDKDFHINPSRGVIIRNPKFTARVAELTNFPVLAGPDVQSQIVRATIKAGKPFIPHFHPRSAEVLNALRGVLFITIKFEGLEPRVVRIKLRSGESTVFPQGLVHTTTCVSQNNCEFLSVFTSADPGLVPV